MYRIWISAVTFMIIQSAMAQTAKQYITLEHFTNTLCSVCKNNNPSLFTNLNNNPGEVHHLAIHPEIPYPACVFYQHNTAGNNYRKNLYSNVFGTPTTIANGTVKGVGASNLLPQSLIDNNRYNTSPLRIEVVESQSGNMLNITVKVKTYRSISNPNLILFVAIAEKYIAYNAPNGENNHYNVFRTMLPANEGVSITPAPVGQEVTQSFSVMMDAAWNPAEIYALVFIQDTASLEMINSGTKFDLIPEAVITPEDCANASNGVISLSVSGGTPPYTYNWSTGATSAMITGLAAGSYTVTIADDGGFEFIDTILVPAANSLQSSLTYTATTANNGTATVIVSGGTAPYEYLWSNGQTTQTATGLGVGYANVTVTDDNGCMISDSIFVSALSITVDKENVSCFGSSDGYISVSIAGGIPPYSFVWSNGGVTDSIGGLVTGNYSLTITDSNNNDFEGTYTINQPQDLAITTTVTAATGGGNNGVASATVTGGTAPYIYNWSNGASTPTASQLGLGAYTLTVTDANGCDKQASVVISPPTGIVQPSSDITFTYYPNPANNQLNIVVPEQADWKMFDLSGAVITGQYLNAGTTTIPVGHLAPGMYIQQIVTTQGKTATARLVIYR